ncbi:MAG: hypothetical protein J0665_11890 [Deltaproteobacteria bacterium]|nr:hypothetical protein [Deltaproteobacteria bacterium]
MLKQLKMYYVLVSLPFALLLVGSALFFDAIKSTIVRNPHPQINYAIFVIILVGGTLIVLSVQRMMCEAKTLLEFSNAIRANTDLATLQDMAINYDGDISYVLRMIAASGGRTISHQEQAAIEHELVKAATRLTRRNALPQYLTGLLVGMGLLGTFIGLLATLNDISALIGSFADLDMSTANPIEVFRNMIERMKAPMLSMGIAFSASLFGLLGSIVLGLMMVGIRRFQGDILSLLGSEVAQHIEFALANDGFTYSKGALKLGLGHLRGDAVSARDVVARPTQPIAMNITTAPTAAAPAGQGTGVGSDQFITTAVTSGGSPAADSTGTNAITTAHAESVGDNVRSGGVYSGDEARILTRIEERLAESTRLQQRTLSTEIDDFQKQRGDMLRTLTEQTEASNNFRGELQRLGRQLGTILGIMEKGNSEVLTQMSELIVRMAGDSTETHKLLILQVEEQQKLNETLKSYLEATGVTRK